MYLVTYRDKDGIQEAEVKAICNIEAADKVWDNYPDTLQILRIRELNIDVLK